MMDEPADDISEFYWTVDDFETRLRGWRIDFISSSGFITVQ